MEKYKKSHVRTINCSQKIELPDGSYSMSDIQDYFEYIQKPGEKTVNPSMRI